MTDLTRRNFIGAGAVAGVALASSAALAIADPAAAEWDIECDVLVCGAGAAGYGAAYGACESGAQTLCIEKAALPGGSFARCSGGMAGCGSKVQKALGIEDNVEDYVEWLKHVNSYTGNPVDEEYIREWAEHSGEQIDWFNDLAVQFTGEEIFMSQWADGFYNGINDSLCPYEELGFPEEKRHARSHWATRKWDKATDSGCELANVMLQAMESFDNYELRCETALQRLIVNADGEVIGVQAVDMATGDDLRIKANQGVVLACGGWSNSPELKAIFMPQFKDVPSYVSLNTTGDSILAAMALGAGLTYMTAYEAGIAGKTFTYNPDYDDVFDCWLTEEGGDGTITSQDPCICECNGGLVINLDGQVKNVFGEVIPRLYAAGCDAGTNIQGNVVASVSASESNGTSHTDWNNTDAGLSVHPGCGHLVSTGLYFGRKAGQHAAGLEKLA